MEESKTKYKEEITKKRTLEEKLPLVIEIIPGQAMQGLVTVFDYEEWKSKDLQSLVKTALEKTYSLEEQELLKKVKEQLTGGKLLSKGKEVESSPLDYAVKERTESGQEYFYIELKAIKPQEGGSLYSKLK